MKNSTHHYSAVADPNGTLTLQKDGKACYCCKHGLTPVQNTIAGGVSFTRLNCTTGCPSANIVAEPDMQALPGDNALFWKISCEGQNLLLPLDKPEEKPKSGLIAV